MSENTGEIFQSVSGQVHGGIQALIGNHNTQIQGNNNVCYIQFDAYSILVPEHQAELDHAKDLINNYNYQQALEYLEKLRQRIWHSTQPIVKYRLLANLGSANLGLDKYQEAAQNFLEAFQYNKDDEKALYIAALGHALLKQLKEAEKFIYKVLEKNSGNESAYALLIQLFPDEELEVVINKVPETYRNSGRVAAALGHIARLQLDFTQAKKWLLTAIDNDKENLIEIRVDLATLLLEDVNTNALLIYAQQLDDADKNKINQAIQLLTEAWKQIENTDFRNLRAGWIFNRGLAKKILGLGDEAISDVNISLQIEPQNPVFIKEKAMLLHYYKSNDSGAIKLLEGIQASKVVPEVPLLLVNILALKKEYSRAKEVINNFIEQKPELPLLEWAYQILVKLYIDAKDTNNIIEVYNLIQEKEPKTIYDLMNLALLADFLDDRNEALKFLREAKGQIDEITPIQWLLEIGNVFSFMEQYAEAASIYEKVVDTNLNTPLNHTLIELYYHSGQFRKALRICQSLHQKYGASKFICQIQSVILEEIGNLAEAKRVCNEYLQLSPDDLQMQIRLALINYRIGSFQEIDDFLRLPIDITSLSLELGLKIVFLYGVRGFKEEYLETLYQLRKKFFDQGKAHFNYFVAFIEGETDNNSLLEHTEVRVDSAVCLEDKYGTSSWFILVDNDNPDVRLEEISLKEPLAQKLLGKVIEDEVTLKEDYITKDTRKIINIKSKYVYAFQASIDLLERRFPETSGIWTIPVDINECKDGLPKNIQIVLDKNSDNFLETERFYKEHAIPIGTLAKLLNRDLISVWGRLISKKDLGVRCCRGDAEERNYASLLLENADKPVRLIIDLVSIITLHALDAADVIVKAFDKLGVAQSTIDIFQQALEDNKRNESKGFGNFVKEGNKYFIQETTPELVKSFVNYLEKIIAWITTNCEILPCNAALDIDRDKRQELEKLIGVSFADTILIASEPGNLLYSDDWALRQVAKAKFNIDGVWTQLILMHCLKDNIIQQTDYNEMVIKLVLCNYDYTSIDALVLIEAAKQSEWLVKKPFINLLNLLGSNSSSSRIILNEQVDRISLNSVVNVTVNFLYELWRQQKVLQISNERRDALVFAILNFLVRGRVNRRALLRRVITEVQQRFYLLPFELTEIISLIRSWATVNLI